MALVAETGDLGWRPLGSLAGIGLSGVVLYALRRAGSLLGAARRVRESIVWVMWLWCCWRGGRVKSLLESLRWRWRKAHGPLAFLLLRSNGSSDFTHHITSHEGLPVTLKQLI